MSKPINELSKFRSYSYYHVLALCDSSQTAANVSAATSLDVWQHPTSVDDAAEGEGPLTKYSPKQFDSSVPGKYVILINGSTDASFVITSAKWTSFTASSATMNDRNTSIALEGSISVSEPRGIMFLDRIVNSCLDLGVDSANTFWVLKTFFVGYTAEDEVEYITNIPPVIFLAYDVVGTFNNTGGEYEIQFVAAANSAARLPHFSKAIHAVNLKAASTLSDTLIKLSDEVNKNYEDYYACVVAQIGAIQGSDDLLNSLRKVKYTIDCDGEYKTTPQNYTVNDQAAQLKDRVDCPEPANIHISAGISIEDAIHRVMGMCPRIKEESNQEGTKFTYKIHSWVKSKPLNDSGQLEFEVGYMVKRQAQPRSVSFEDFADGEGLSKENQKNVIEFDYLYTGKNTDIIEFDIKMNMGMVYLQGMTIANPYKAPGQKISNKTTTVSASDINLRWNGNNIPIFFGTQIKTASIRDTYDGLTSAQNAYSMSKHASLEVLEASVKIMGNSQLLGSINRTTNPDEIKTLQELEVDDGYARFSNWSLAPSFAKINIKMPRNNDDISLFTGSQTSTEDESTSADYAVDFWFSGYYYVYGIEHVFDSGEFYQILQAMGIPEKNSFKVEQQKVQTRDLELDKKVMACYDQSANFGCVGEGSGSSSNVMYYPQDGNASSGSINLSTIPYENLPDDIKGMNNVKGWKELDNTESGRRVKQAILNAAKNNGLNENETVILARMAYIESGYAENGTNPGIKSTTGCTGIFQFSQGTWKGTMKGVPLSQRSSLELNADAGAKLLKNNIREMGISNPNIYNIYMAHNQGSGGAEEVQRLISSGRGGQAPSSITSKALNVNNIHDHSANGIMAWTQKFVSKSFVKGIPTVQPNNTQQQSNNPEQNEIPPQNQPLTNKQVLGNTFNCSEDKSKQDDPAKKDSGCNLVPKVEGSPTDNNTTTTGQLNQPLVNVVSAPETPTDKFKVKPEFHDHTLTQEQTVLTNINNNNINTLLGDASIDGIIGNVVNPNLAQSVLFKK